MPIYDDHKTIHIHIPKVAGSFLYHYLFQYPANLPNWTTLCGWVGEKTLNHMAYMELKEHVPKEKLDAYFIFTVVRNPYAKLVSEYNFHKGFYGNDFKKFVKNIGEYRDAKLRRHLMPQYIFLLNETGKIDNKIKIYKHEDFENAVKDICQHAGIEFKPEVLKTKHNATDYHGKSYKDYYDKETIEMVKRIYKMDFLMLGYSEDL